MARAYHPCAKCAKDVTVTARNSKEAARYAAFCAKRGDLCDACKRADFAARAFRAAEARREAGLPELIGSDKQVAWAETLRREILADFTALGEVVDLEIAYKAVERPEQKDKIGRQAERLYRSLRGYVAEAYRELGNPDHYPIFMSILREADNASFWIDIRDIGGAPLVKRLRPEIEDRARRDRDAEVSTTPEAIAAIDESIIRPIRPKSQLIATIKLIADHIEVRFGERDDLFNQTIKSLGYRWDKNQNHWAMTLGFCSGEPIDRLAEVAHRIVAAGFIVSLHHDEARNRAISGDFKSDNRRRISALKGKYEGWYLLSWSRADDLYAAARSLPGSRYKDKMVMVPAAAADAILDFTEKYDFSLSSGARKLIAEHHQAMENGATISTIVDRPIAVITTEDAKPAPLAPPTDAQIDDELRDDV